MNTICAPDWIKLTRDEARLAVEGLGGISSGDAGSYPVVEQRAAADLADRIREALA